MASRPYLKVKIKYVIENAFYVSITSICVFISMESHNELDHIDELDRLDQSSQNRSNQKGHLVL